jgi:rhodanese-related sulfurtransferase
MENFDPQTIWLSAIVIMAFVAMKYVIPRLMAGGAPFVEAEDVNKRLTAGDEIVVLDVRTPGEFTGSLGHIPGAVNVPLAELAGRLSVSIADFEGLKNEPIYVICRTANRSPNAARLLRKNGFTDVSVIKGGMSAWKRSGFPAEAA